MDGPSLLAMRHTDSFANYLRAGYPCLWVDSLEPERVERDLAAVAVEVKKAAAYRWDVGQGMVELGDQARPRACPSPVQAVAMAAAAPQGTVTFLWNFHRFLASVEVVQTVQNAIPSLKAGGRCLVVLAPSSEKIPPELARSFALLEFQLPSLDDLAVTLRVIAEAAGAPVPDETRAILEAARGLTASEAEDAFALSLVEAQAFDPGIIAREKAAALLRQTQLQVSRFQERFSDLGGLEVVKSYLLRVAPSPMSLGILLLGVPGTGKSHLAKALGNELGVPCLSLDFGRMMASLVGESEARIRAALQAVDAMGRCVLFIDEIEKGLAGTRSSGVTDSGVKAGVASTFLKWLSDRQPGKVYVVATCNRIQDLPPEYQRAERWDGVFFVDLPHQGEREAIWKIHAAIYGVGGPRPDDANWTGAEIKACCRTAAMMGCSLVEAARYVVPIARSMSEEIDALREWAEGRAVPASKPDTTKLPRKVNLGPRRPPGSQKPDLN